MIISFMAEGLLELSTTIISWSVKKSYNIFNYMYYKEEKILINKKELDLLYYKINEQEKKIFLLENNNNNNI